MGVDPDDRAHVPFGRAWVDALGAIVTGAEVEGLAGRRISVQLGCVDAGVVRPWRVDVDDGVISALSPTADPNPRIVLSHGVTVGWRLLGLSIKGHHRVDELTIEQRVRSRWQRFPIPPLDARPIDLRPSPPADATLRWNDRVIDSPLGTLYVQHVVGEGRIAVVHASTHPRIWPETEGAVVDSDVTWAALVGVGGGHEPGRAWRGRREDIVRVQLAQRLEADRRRDAARAARITALCDAMTVFEGLRSALRSDPRWRDLWRPRASPSRR